MIYEVIGILLILLLTYALETARKRRHGPPGPVRWPIVGNIIEMFMEDSKYPHLALAAMAKKYGDVMSIGYGVHNAVVISSYDAMKEILTEDCMLGRYAFPFSTDRAKDEHLGLVWSDVTHWRVLRKFLLKSLRKHGFGKTGVMDDVGKKEIGQMKTHILSLIEKSDGVLRVDSRFFAICSGNICLTLIGAQRFDYEDKEFLNFIGLSSIEINLLSLNYICNPFPFLLKCFPKWTRQAENLAVYGKVVDFMKNIITTSENKRSKREDKTAGSVIEEFLDEIEKNHEKSGTAFTETEMTLVLLDLLSGSEIIGPMLKWVFLFLTLNPDVQAKVRLEIATIEAETGKAVSNFDSKAMSFTQAVIFESLRMADISPLPPQRKALQDCHYNQYKISKGTPVLWNMHPVLNDPNYWGDPHVFRPDRFLDDSGRLVKTDRVAAVFGFGKRVCPGASYTMDILFMVVTDLLKTFTFEAIPGKMPSIENPYSAITISPKSYFAKMSVRK